jgi:prephenate dehydrogenase
MQLIKLMHNKKYKVAIIGFGRFGALMHKILSEKWQAEVVVVSSRKLTEVKQMSLTDATRFADLIIPAVPISQFSEWISKIAFELNDTHHPAVVVDVCSVKTWPAQVMMDRLAREVGIIATHPMWGPDSTKNGTELADLKFIYKVLRNNGTPVIDDFIQFWRDSGQEVIELDPVKHDQQAAYTHAFAFLIGKLGMRLKVRSNNISTKGFSGILYNQTAVENDTGQLFEDMFTYNPFAKEMLQQFQVETLKIYQELY